jgi:hypothetical protein
MIEMRRRQLSFGDGLIEEEVSDLRESWMIHADAVLADDDIVAAVYEALAKRHPKSRCRGRRGAPAEMVLRLLVLKHIRNWKRRRLTGKTTGVVFELAHALGKRILLIGVLSIGCRSIRIKGLLFSPGRCSPRARAA